LRQLDQLGRTVDLVTADLLAAVPPGASMYQLKNRLKSPSSLARKVAGRLDQTRQPTQVEDVLRYTYLVRAEQLVELAKEVTEELQVKGWHLAGARNSYVEHSRYKGLHLDWRTTAGQRIEVQVHTPESVAVKEATTKLYEIERDRRRPRHERDVARAECVRLSASLVPPHGLTELRTLGQCTVDVRGYGVSGDSVPSAGRKQQDGRKPRQERGQNLERDRMQR
jgi:hypothetical protein